MKRMFALILCLLLSFVSAHSSNDGGTVSPFRLGAGARDLSLGGAVIAAGDVATAPFWNASRLAQAEQFAITGFHSNLYESDVKYQYFGLVIPTLDFGNFGIGIFRLGVNDIEKRDAGNLLLGSTDDSRLRFNLAYGRTVSGYDIGVSVTMEHHSLDSYSSTSSPGVNVSVSKRIMYDNKRLKKIAFALVGNNLIQPGYKLVQENVEYPVSVTGGVSVAIQPNPNWNHVLTISGSMTKYNKIDPRLAVGVEYNINDILQLRGGRRDNKFSFGIGITHKGISFDYALVDRDLGSIHMFSLTTSFGTSLTEKRHLRAKQREMEFNNLMSKRLTARNVNTVSELIRQGNTSLESGDLVEASKAFDRALFLARGSALDTTHIYKLAAETKQRLEDITRKRQYRQYLDSAQVKYDNGDYLAAEYFANLALKEIPNSTIAANLAKQASDAIKQSLSHEETIKKHLQVADSLLWYGQTKEAMVVIDNLCKLDPDDERVVQARLKAEFEQWRAIASAAYDSKDYESAQVALDSALALFPGHRWCLDLQKQIRNRLKAPSPQPVKESPVPVQPLSPELQKEIALAYKTAQKLFKKGELAKAIEHWEKVERLAPNYQMVRKYLVNAYKYVGVEAYGHNKLQQAIAAWKKAMQLDPQNSEIRNYLTRTETEIQKLKELSYEQ